MRPTAPVPFDETGPRVARRFIEQYAAERPLPHDAAPALAIIATELVTNAISHGAAPVELTVHDNGDSVTVEVSDGDTHTTAVRPREPDQPRPGGRGLGIVAALADEWGARSLPSGKAVWATMRLTPYDERVIDDSAR